MDQINAIGLGQVAISDGAGPGNGSRTPWLQAGFDDRVVGNGANLQLWATGGSPVLLVSVTLAMPGGGPDPLVDDNTEGRTPPEPESRVDDSDRSEGDVLFTEGDDLHLPAGTRSLMPTMPTMRGSGGSTSVIAAEDGASAIQDLLDEADATTGSGEVRAPVTTALDGVEVINASFNIPAGGWGFSVVAVQGPDDPAATLHVVSYAD